MTTVSLLAPPRIGHDAGFGLLRWSSWLAGAPFDTVVDPDPADIAKDALTRATWWSPGQYLAPGLLTLTGLRLGSAVVLIAGLCEFIGLAGWIAVIRAFALGPRLALMAVALMATLRWTTATYGLYEGGEVLLQAATPWIVLAALKVPDMRGPVAALVAFAVVIIAFLAKLNGLIVVGAAFAAVGVLTLQRERRLPRGLIDGGAGALIALLALYALWFAGRHTTHFSGGGAPFDMVHMLFALVAPWTSALAWQDLLAFMLQRPGHELVHQPATLIIGFMTPLAVVLAIVALRCGPGDDDSDTARKDAEAQLRRFTFLFVVFFVAAMLALYALRSPIPLEERHYRPAGMLLLLVLLAIALKPQAPRLVRLGLIGLFAVMACYGLTSFAARALHANRQPVDPASWTILTNADPAALNALRQAYAQEGRDAVFYLGGPELIVALPPGARVILDAPDLIPVERLAARHYAGHAKGRLYVLINRALPDAKAKAILASFTGYDPGAWRQTTFARAAAYEQRAAASNGR